MYLEKWQLIRDYFTDPQIRVQRFGANLSA